MTMSIYSNKEKLQYALHLARKFGGLSNAMSVIDEMNKFMPEGNPERKSLKYVHNLLMGDTTHLILDEECQHLLKLLMDIKG